MRSLAFRMFSANSCLMYEAFERKLNAFPFKLFRILQEKNPDEQLGAVQECLSPSASGTSISTRGRA